MGTIVSGDYWTKGNELADLLVKYRFYQESQVTSISEGRWEQNSGAGNYVKVTYVGKDQQTRSENAWSKWKVYSYKSQGRRKFRQKRICIFLGKRL